MDTRFPITLPAGVVRNDSAYAVKGRYINSSFVHFWEGKPQKWGGWGNYFNLAFTEPARGGVIWNANDGRTLSAFGTANKLWLMREGALYDITPNGLTTGLVNSATADSGYGADGYGSGPYGGGWTAFAGQGSFPRVWTVCKWGEDLVACPRGGPIYFWDYSAANLGRTMTGTTSNTSTTVSALTNDTAIVVGDRVTGTGIPVDTFVSSVNTVAHTMVISHAATASGTGVTLTFTSPAVALSTLTADAALPSVALGIFVTDDRELVAFGAAQSPQTYDALNIAWCDREDFTVWTPSDTNTAGAIRCETGNQIMGAVRVFGGWLILTDLSAHPFTFQGGDDIWGLDRVGSTGGAIGPHAMVEVDGVAYWMGPNAIHSYNGRVNTVPCDVHEAVYNNINRLQAYKICAGTVRRYGLLIWFLPGTLTSLENDSYFGVNTFDSTWELGGSLADTDDVPVAAFSRTTWIDSNALFKTPLGTDGSNYKIYQHEAGTTADGVPIAYALETGEIELKAEGGSIQASDTFIRLKKVAPDWAYISGAHSLTIKARGYANDPEVEKGPYDMTGVMFNPKARGRSFRFLMTGTGDMRLGDMEAYGSPDGGRR